MCTSDQSCPEGATNPVLRCTLGELPSPLFNILVPPSIISVVLSRLKNLGWTVGFEPSTTGATILRSAAELRPPHLIGVTGGN